ncbi:MAG TPA: 50S ribosomal protein L13 [bacterium]|jgi:large subunit ribosomal protein L13|nr:50S ribosomal protein L13 [bacterium]MDX9805579.1 50S ribosomal protein L13 [bacterium]HNW15654.1 50S ribosomal protein L13 [bacterium]HNZ53528.1 50S ribosomal protein L13 [bacterium]HOG44241.1 50S ribosomal protein L13 [bacterium]
MKLTRYTRSEDVKRVWFEISAEGLTLGRLATRVADVLRGKNKPHYTPSVDCGDYVIITNAGKINMTGKKWTDKKYYSYSGYQSGMRELSAEKMVQKHPEHLIMHAVKGMLPKNKLANQVIRKLKVYEGNEHPHTAQEPKKLEL